MTDPFEEWVLAPTELTFDEWCAEQENKRRFREWAATPEGRQAMLEIAARVATITLFRRVR